MRRLLGTLAKAGLVGGAAFLAQFGGALASSAVFLANSTVFGEDFQPTKEAEMPRGFPGYTPVGRIEVKQYPAYRKASTSGNAEFWTLFLHIKQNDVQMTAPVELDYGEPRGEKLKERSMSFLYERPDQGAAGKQGAVEVVDVPAMMVISIGCRGARNAASLTEAREKLIHWLDEHKAEYAAAGPLRAMGYNSPFVPREKNFFEVQIPVKPAEGEKEKEKPSN